MANTTRIATILALSLFCLAAVAPGTPIFFGEDEGVVWLEIQTAASKLGFRLNGSPEGRVGVQLLFPDLPQEQQCDFSGS